MPDKRGSSRPVGRLPRTYFGGSAGGGALSSKTLKRLHAQMEKGGILGRLQVTLSSLSSNANASDVESAIQSVVNDIDAKDGKTVAKRLGLLAHHNHTRVAELWSEICACTDELYVVNEAVEEAYRTGIRALVEATSSNASAWTE
eukprot:3975476-Prymnesium_polylepis.1